jgi:cyclopropane-fatty-acyl-phospholipid synthase
MGLLSLEQDEMLVWADFAVYGLLVVLCGVMVVLTLPATQAGAARDLRHTAWPLAAWVLAGWAGWSLAEYGLHRFVLHGLRPFARLHAMHHARPLAHIATPTVVTTALFALLVALPAWWLLLPWHAAALMLGVLGAYLAYIGTHHAVHHRRGTSAWLDRHKRWHAMHHRVGAQACYGVSGPLWDHVFGTARPRVRQRTDVCPPRP